MKIGIIGLATNDILLFRQNLKRIDLTMNKKLKSLNLINKEKIVCAFIFWWIELYKYQNISISNQVVFK